MPIIFSSSFDTEIKLFILDQVRECQELLFTMSLNYWPRARCLLSNLRWHLSVQNILRVEEETDNCGNNSGSEVARDALNKINNKNQIIYEWIFALNVW